VQTITGALVNAGAIVRYLQALQPEIVTIVRMGHEARENSDEDDICAELLRSRLLGEPMPVSRGIPSVLGRMPECRERRDAQDRPALLGAHSLLVAGIRERLRKASSAEKFFDPACDWAPERDFDLCTRVDEFDFVLQLDRAVSPPRLRKIDVPKAEPRP
jgi:2-phosphosulfolactate phosphatase